MVWAAFEQNLQIAARRVRLAGSQQLADVITVLFPAWRAVDAPPDDTRRCVTQVPAELVVPSDPRQPLIDRLGIVHSRRLAQCKQRHRRHAILMDTVDGILSQHSASRSVVVPPPLAQWTLDFAYGLSALPRHLKGGVDFICLRESSQRIDRVHLVGKAADAAPENARQSFLYGQVPEDAMVPLIIAQ